MPYQSLSYYLQGSPIPLVGSHRGISRYSSKKIENTLDSIFSANNSTADYCEVDLMFTQDHQLILFHDSHLNTSSIEKSLFTHLQKSNLAIQKLEDLLTKLAHSVKPKLLNIEIKSYEHTLDEKKQFISTLLNKLDIFKLKDRVLISSFNQDILLMFRQQSAQYKIALLLNPKETIQIPNKLKMQLDALCPHIDLLDSLEDITLPNFVWEKSNETKIKEKLESLLKTNTIFDWIKRFNVYGLTTNDVQESFNLMNKSS